MKLPTARDLMVPLEAYPHVHEHCSLRTALETLNGAHIEMHGDSSLPRILLVFDDSDALVGLARRRDILKGLSPRWFFKAEADHPEALFHVEMEESISEVLADKVVSRFQDRAELSIEEYVRPIEGIVEAEDSLIRVVNIMVGKGHYMLAVLELGRVIGVVRSIEVMWEVNEILKGRGVVDT